MALRGSIVQRRLRRIVSVEHGMECGNLQMSFDVFLHRVTVLVSDPTWRTAGGMVRAPIRRDARDKLHNGVPGDARSGGDNRWIRGVCNHQVTTFKSACEIRHEERGGIHTQQWRCVPIHPLHSYHRNVDKVN